MVLMFTVHLSRPPMDWTLRFVKAWTIWLVIFWIKQLPNQNKERSWWAVIYNYWHWDNWSHVLLPRTPIFWWGHDPKSSWGSNWLRIVPTKRFLKVANQSRFWWLIARLKSKKRVFDDSRNLKTHCSLTRSSKRIISPLYPALSAKEGFLDRSSSWKKLSFGHWTIGKFRMAMPSVSHFHQIPRTQTHTQPPGQMAGEYDWRLSTGIMHYAFI